MARRVVVAGGIQPFAYRPEAFRGLPRCARHPHIGAARLRQVQRQGRARRRRRSERARVGGLHARGGRPRGGADSQARRALAREEAAVAAREGDPMDVLRPGRHRAGRRQPLRPASESVSPAAAPRAGLVGASSDSAGRVRSAHGEHRRGHSARTVSGRRARRRGPRPRSPGRRFGSRGGSRRARNRVSRGRLSLSVPLAGRRRSRPEGRRLPGAGRRTRNDFARAALCRGAGGLELRPADAVRRGHRIRRPGAAAARSAGPTAFGSRNRRATCRKPLMEKRSAAGRNDRRDRRRRRLPGPRDRPKPRPSRRPRLRHRRRALHRSVLAIRHAFREDGVAPRRASRRSTSSATSAGGLVSTAGCCTRRGTKRSPRFPVTGPCSRSSSACRRPTGARCSGCGTSGTPTAGRASSASRRRAPGTRAASTSWKRFQVDASAGDQARDQGALRLRDEGQGLAGEHESGAAAAVRPCRRRTSAPAR